MTTLEWKKSWPTYFVPVLASSTRRGLCHGLNKHPKLEKGKIEVTSYHYDYLPRLTQDFNWKKLKGLKLTLDQREVKHEIAENIYTFDKKYYENRGIN